MNSWILLKRVENKRMIGCRIFDIVVEFEIFSRWLLEIKIEQKSDLFVQRS